VFNICDGGGTQASVVLVLCRKLIQPARGHFLCELLSSQALASMVMGCDPCVFEGFGVWQRAAQ
jgi:hypothetical protein